MITCFVDYFSFSSSQEDKIIIIGTEITIKDLNKMMSCTKPEDKMITTDHDMSNLGNIYTGHAFVLPINVGKNALIFINSVVNNTSHWNHYFGRFHNFEVVIDLMERLCFECCGKYWPC
jgi:hypothetical protein